MPTIAVASRPGAQEQPNNGASGGNGHNGSHGSQGSSYGGQYHSLSLGTPLSGGGGGASAAGVGNSVAAGKGMRADEPAAVGRQQALLADLDDTDILVRNTETGDLPSRAAVPTPAAFVRN